MTRHDPFRFSRLSFLLPVALLGFSCMILSCSSEDDGFFGSGRTKELSFEISVSDRAASASQGIKEKGLAAPLPTGAEEDYAAGNLLDRRASLTPDTMHLYTYVSQGWAAPTSAGEKIKTKRGCAYGAHHQGTVYSCKRSDVITTETLQAFRLDALREEDGSMLLSSAELTRPDHASGVWLQPSGKTQWGPENATRRFWAYAAAGNAADPAWWRQGTGNQAPTIENYTPDGGEDLLICATGSRRHPGAGQAVPLTFRHALTAIRFQTSDLEAAISGQRHQAVKVVEVTLCGVYTRGSATLPQTTDEGGGDLEWTPDETSKGSYICTIQQATDDSTAATPMQGEGQALFFVLPQVMPQTARLEVTYHLVSGEGIYDPVGLTQKDEMADFSLAGQELRAGQTFTYRLTPDMRNDFQMTIDTKYGNTFSPWNRNAYLYHDLNAYSVQQSELPISTHESEIKRLSDSKISMSTEQHIRSDFQHSYIVDWGDGTRNIYYRGTTRNATHTYATTGRFPVKIMCLSPSSTDRPVMERFDFARSRNDTYNGNCTGTLLVSVDKPLPRCDAVDHMFFYCNNLVSIPDSLFKNCPSPRFTQTFYNCSKLGSDPSAPLPDNIFCSGGECFEQCFKNCSGLTSLPLGLFDHCQAGGTGKIKTNIYPAGFKNCFEGCTGLTSLPIGLFALSSEAGSFEQCFKGCTKLTVLPQNLFHNCHAAQTFSSCFEGCTKLATIQPGAFGGCAMGQDFSACFKDCKALTALPAGFFDDCQAAQDFSSCFENCTALTGVGQDFFAAIPNASEFGSCFKGCTALTTADAIFRGCANATNFSNCFSGCSRIASVSPDLFGSCAKARDFNNCFYKCSALTGSIPGTLFQDCPDAMDFSNCFYLCSSLTGSIPSTLFQNCTKANNFSSCFKNCGKLTGAIPNTLFHNCPDVTTFANCFSSCEGLTGAIPQDLFLYAAKASDFTSCFSSCKGLTALPAGLFDNVPLASNFSSCFSYCRGLTALPAGLFDNVPQASNFVRCFEYCTGLTGSVPAAFFSRVPKVQNFSYCFQNCTGLTGSLPAACFRGCAAATNFSYCFQYCNGLTGSVPADLFEGCAAATNFNHCFRDCGLLAGAGDHLFAYCPAANGFNGCFYNCRSFKMNATIFTLPGQSIADRFGGKKNLDFNSCFYAVGMNKVTYTYDADKTLTSITWPSQGDAGDLPPLWEIPSSSTFYSFGKKGVFTAVPLTCGGFASIPPGTTGNTDKEMFSSSDWVYYGPWLGPGSAKSGYYYKDIPSEMIPDGLPK